MSENIDPETLKKIETKKLELLVREGFVDYSVNDKGGFIFWLTPKGDAEWAKHQEH